MIKRPAALLVEWAERGLVPDRLLRAGIDRVVAARLRNEAGKDRAAERDDFWHAAWDGPITVRTRAVNRQHYEVPPGFFELVLGPRLKYSAAYWPEGMSDLAGAEEAMLELTATRAGIQEGQAILDLGCGWGSFSLWAAERFPDSDILAVSNSRAQRRFIEERAAARGLHNVAVLTTDIAEFAPGRTFDRIVSVEMLEHVRNHRAVFRAMRSWLEPDGAAFVHVFAHRRYAYPFEAQGPGDWMADTFFTGGVMPSRDLLPVAAAGHLDLDGDWWIDGTHYMKTLEAWLTRLDARRSAVRAELESAYGEDVDLWIQRWRMFFMACSQMFGRRDGTEWGIAHYRFAAKV